MLFYSLTPSILPKNADRGNALRPRLGPLIGDGKLEVQRFEASFFTSLIMARISLRLTDGRF